MAIEDLYLVAEPNHDNAALDASTTAAERMESLRRVLEQRLKRVAERELLRQAINETPGDESGPEGYKDEKTRLIQQSVQQLCLTIGVMIDLLIY